MGSFMAFLVALARKAGTKLPQIWPYLMHIASDLREIATIIGVNVNDEKFMSATGPVAELKQLCEQNDIDMEDCEELITCGQAADEAAA